MSAELTATLQRVKARRPDWTFSEPLVEVAHQIWDAENVNESGPLSGSVRVASVCLTREASDSRKSHTDALRTKRQCTNFSGLIFEHDDGSRTYRISPCHRCEHCRRWDAEVDAFRAGEVITNPVVTFIAEERWQAVRKRLKRQGLEYVASPAEPSHPRMVIVDASTDLPVAGPVDDLAGLLYEASEKRQRKRDRRQVSSSAGVRSKTAIKQECYPQKPAEDNGSFVGVYVPKTVSHSEIEDEVIDALETTAEAAQVPHVRERKEIRVTVGRNDPRAVFFDDRISARYLRHAVPWFQGGDPPKPGDPSFGSYEKAQAAQQWRAVFEEPPEEVYNREAAAVYEEHWVA